MRSVLLFFFVQVCVVSMLSDCTRAPVAKQHITANQIDTLIAHGIEYCSSGKLDSVVAVAKKLDIDTGQTGNKKALVYSELFMANYYWLSADPKTSLAIILKCLGDAEKYNTRIALPGIYSVIGNLHKENSNYKLAFNAADTALYWAKANRDTSAIIAAMGLKAMLIHTANEALLLPLNDTSIHLQVAALKIAGTNPKYSRICIAFYDNMAGYYLDNKDYKNAIYYGDMGAALATRYNRQRSLTYSYARLGLAWFKLGDRQRGFGYLDKALQIAHDIKQPYREMELYTDLYGCYNSIGDYKTAIRFNMIAQKKRDSLQVQANEKQMSELELKYETVKKDKELVTATHYETIQQRKIAIVLLGFALIIILSVALLLQYSAIKRKNSIINKSNVKKEQALVDIAYIQSHELRKPLASILGLINVIKASGGDVDPECLEKLEEAGKELDEKIHAVTSHITEAN